MNQSRVAAMLTANATMTTLALSLLIDTRAKIVPVLELLRDQL
jgi:hypothetical protein